MKSPIRKTSTSVLGKAAHFVTLALLVVFFSTGAAFAQLKAYVVNVGNNTLSVIDVATNTTVGTIPLPGTPFFLTVNAAGSRAYVGLISSNRVAVVNLATNAVVATVPVGTFPAVLSLSGDEAFLYVPNRISNTVSVINTATNTVVTTLTVGPNPLASATSPDGASVWVASANASITVIDTPTNTVTSSFAVPSPVINSIVFAPDGAFAYLTDLFGNNCLVVDTATRTVVATIPTGNSPSTNVITPDGATVYQTNEFGNSVSVIDTATNTVIATVPVGASPVGTAITPDGAFVYVANSGSGTVSVIDTATNTVAATISGFLNPFDIAIPGLSEEPPVLTSDNASVTVNEGQTATNTGTVTDANGDTVTLTASVGTVINNGNGTWSWSFTTSDGPTQSQTVTITGDDTPGPASLVESTGSTSFSLTVNNLPPTITSVSNNGPIIAGGSATITVTATDPAGAADPLAYEFDCDNNGLYEIGPQAGNSASCTFASAGNHTVNVRVTDGDGGAATGSTVVTAQVPPPNCATAVVSPNRIWPPNHKLVPVQISGISGALTVSVTGIFQDESTQGLGDGNTCPDGTGIGTSTANVRAERSALGDGRIYTISFTATGAGGSCQGSVQVCVPHNNNGSCGNGGASVNSTVCGSGGSTLKWSAPYSGKQHTHKGLLCASHLPTRDCDLFCDAGLILCH